MNFIATLDLIAASASLVALYLILSTLVGRPRQAELVLFSMVAFLTFTHDLGNFVEWVGLSNWFDPIEDFMEVLTAGLWAFFFYTLAQEHTERRLRASEEKYRTLFDAGNDAVIVHRLNRDGTPGGIVEVNDVACRMLEYSREEFRNLNPANIDAPEAAEDTPEVMRTLLDTGRAVFERIHVSKSGRKVPVEVSSRLFDLHGETLVISFVRDVSERKDAERKIRELQDLDEKILEGSPVAFVLHDTHMRVIRVSKAYQGVTGFMPERVLGKTLHEFMPEGTQRDKIIDAIQRAKEYGIQVGPADIDSPIPGRYLRETILPVFGADGKVANILSVLEDITEQKKAADALEESEARYRMLFDSIRDGVVVHGIREDNTPDNFLEVNSRFCEMIGYSRPELLKKGPHGVIDSEHMEGADQLRAQLKNGVPDSFQRVLITKDGRRIPCEVNAFSLEMGGRQVILSVVRDTTFRQEAEKRIRSSLAEKETLLKEIHHRVKNNLQVISGLLNLQSHYIDDESVRSIYKESQNRIKTMALIHEELYQRDDLARINLAEYVRDLTQNLLASYMVKKGSVELVLDIPDMELNLDTAIPCGLIVNELVSNALKHAFTEEVAGKIAVSVARDGEVYSLVISDNGKGFPEGVDFRKVKSMGMQLVTVLAEQLGGNVQYSGTSGSTFTVTFKEYQESGTEVH